MTATRQRQRLDPEAVRRLIVDERLSPGEAAKRLGVRATTVCGVQRRHGWRTHPTALQRVRRAADEARKRTLAARRVADTPVEAVYSMLYEERLGVHEIAAKLDVPASRIRYVMERRGWRTSEEARKRARMQAAAKRENTRPERTPDNRTTRLEMRPPDEPVLVRCGRCGWAEEVETQHAAETFRSHACCVAA